MRLLLKHNREAVETAVGSSGWKALHVALRFGQCPDASVVALAETSAQACIVPNPEGWRSIHLAARYGASGVVVRALIANAARARTGATRLAEQLLMADVGPASARGSTPPPAYPSRSPRQVTMSSAPPQGYHGDPAVLPTRLGGKGDGIAGVHGPLVDSVLRQAISARKLRDRQHKAQLEVKSSRNSSEQKGWLPLHLVLRFGTTDPDVVLALLEQYPRATSIPDPDGWLPLHSAAWHHSVPAVVLVWLKNIGRDARPEDAYADGKTEPDVSLPPLFGWDASGLGLLPSRRPISRRRIQEEKQRYETVKRTGKLPDDAPVANWGRCQEGELQRSRSTVIRGNNAVLTQLQVLLRENVAGKASIFGNATRFRRRMFEEIDANHDGEITQEELVKALERFSLQHDAKQQHPQMTDKPVPDMKVYSGPNISAETYYEYLRRTEPGLAEHLPQHQSAKAGLNENGEKVTLGAGLWRSQSGVHDSRVVQELLQRADENGACLAGKLLTN